MGFFCLFFFSVCSVAVVFVFWFCRVFLNAHLLINFQCFLYWSLFLPVFLLFNNVVGLHINSEMSGNSYFKKIFQWQSVFIWFQSLNYSALVTYVLFSLGSCSAFAFLVFYYQYEINQSKPKSRSSELLHVDLFRVYEFRPCYPKPFENDTWINMNWNLP